MEMLHAKHIYDSSRIAEWPLRGLWILMILWNLIEESIIWPHTNY